MIRLAAALKGRYVYRDFQTAELVIGFPSTANDPASPLTIYRYRPRNQLRAQLQLPLKPDPAGGIFGTYTLGSGAGAEAPISVWFMVGADGDTELRSSSPDWAFIRFHGKLKQSALPGMPAGEYLYWTSRGIERVFIQPGGKPRDFQIASTFLLEVTEQLVALLAFEEDNQVLLTICPMFAPSSDKASIAGVWQLQLGELGKISSPEEKTVYGWPSQVMQACSSKGDNSCLSDELKTVLAQRRNASTALARSWRNRPL